MQDRRPSPPDLLTAEADRLTGIGLAAESVVGGLVDAADLVAAAVLRITCLPETSQEPIAVSSPTQPRVPPREPLPRLVSVRNMSQEPLTRQLPTIDSFVTSIAFAAIAPGWPPATGAVAVGAAGNWEAPEGGGSCPP